MSFLPSTSHCSAADHLSSSPLRRAIRYPLPHRLPSLRTTIRRPHQAHRTLRLRRRSPEDGSSPFSIRSDEVSYLRSLPRTQANCLHSQALWRPLHLAASLPRRLHCTRDVQPPPTLPHGPPSSRRDLGSPLRHRVDSPPRCPTSNDRSRSLMGSPRSTTRRRRFTSSRLRCPSPYVGSVPPTFPRSFVRL